MTGETMPVKQAASKRKKSTGAGILLRYRERDNGPLTRQQMDEIRRLQPPGRMKVQESLF